MRILLIHNYYQLRGGEDSVFEAEADLLAQNGHTVETLTVYNTGIQSWLDKLNTGIKALYNPQAARLLNQTITRTQPDIIHVHNFFPLLSPALFYIARRHRIPVVMTLHNFRLICPGALLFRDQHPCELCIDKPFAWAGIRYGCYRHSALQTAPVAMMSAMHSLLKTWQKQVHRYIALSRFSRDKFLQSALALAPEQLAVKPNFVFDAGCNLDNPQDYVLYVGRLSAEKGVHVLLDAISRYPYPVKIAGTGPLEPMVQEAAQNHPHLEYLGFQEGPQVRELMKGARALIFPSIWYENCPVTLIEALSTGTPVITSNLGGAAEMIAHEVTGWHFEAGNTNALTDRLNLIRTDDALLLKARYHARQTYLERYTPEQNYRQLLEIYHGLCHPNPA